MIGEIVRVSYS